MRWDPSPYIHTHTIVTKTRSQTNQSVSPLSLLSQSPNFPHANPHIHHQDRYPVNNGKITVCLQTLLRNTITTAVHTHTLCINNHVIMVSAWGSGVKRGEPSQPHRHHQDPKGLIPVVPHDHDAVPQAPPPPPPITRHEHDGSRQTSPFVASRPSPRSPPPPPASQTWPAAASWRRWAAERGWRRRPPRWCCRTSSWCPCRTWTCVSSDPPGSWRQTEVRRLATKERGQDVRRQSQVQNESTKWHKSTQQVNYLHRHWNQ